MPKKKRAKPRKRTYRSTLRGSRTTKPGWKRQGWEREASKEKLPERITVENSCWRFQ